MGYDIMTESSSDSVIGQLRCPHESLK